MNTMHRERIWFFDFDGTLSSIVQDRDSAELHPACGKILTDLLSMPLQRDDGRGVLILSQFTGASRELPEALIVNHYDIDQCAAALHLALLMPTAEQRDRMRVMRGLISEFNVYRWAGRMLLDAAVIRRRGRLFERSMSN